ncbi:MAG: HisA/HisF-related TIM barrel protein, partial [Bacteroidota bacterium]
EIIASTKVNLIASGGIASIADVVKMKDIGCEGTIIGKALYEGNISLKELSTLC